MRIDSKENLAGVPMLKVRHLLKKKYDREWIAEGASDLLDISQEVVYLSIMK